MISWSLGPLEMPTPNSNLPGVVDHLISTGAARVRVLEGGGPWYGLTYPEDKPEVVAGIAALVRRGVYPEMLW